MSIFVQKIATLSIHRCNLRMHRRADENHPKLSVTTKNFPSNVVKLVRDDEDDKIIIR